MSSEMHVEAQRLEDPKKRKKRIKPPQTQEGADYDDTIQTPSEPKPTAPTPQSIKLPTRSRTRAHSSRDDPMDRVSAFLTEMPSLE